MTPIGVLVSGRGSNLEAILTAQKRGLIGDGEVVAVISNRSGVRAIEVAERFGVPAAVIESKNHSGTREEYDGRLVEALRRRGVTATRGLVLLAGFDRILSGDFVRHFHRRLVNIHPSLLPAFPGLHAQRQALEYGAKVAGCTVHFVSPEVDAGPIIIQRAVRVREGDTEESLSARILREEHIAYPLAVRLLVEKRLKLEGRRVRVSA